MSDLETLEQANREARRAVYELERERDTKEFGLKQAALAKITESIMAEYGERLTALRARSADTERALAVAKTAEGAAKLGDYPSGVMVEWRVPRRSWHGRAKEPTGRRGHFEVCTIATEFAANMGSWQAPKPGDIFIRLIKKDGTPGLKIATGQWNGFADWLPEGEKPKHVEAVA